MTEFTDQALSNLRKAHRDGDLTLYLGAGISVDSGLPTWEKLVLAMYFSALTKESLGKWRPFPNYLFAIAEWHLGRAHEPLEITARKIRECYADDDVFLQHLRETLYAGFVAEYGAGEPGLNSWAIRDGNRTLDAVATLCENRPLPHGAVSSVITYNYDNLLEAVIGDSLCQPVFGQVALEPASYLSTMYTDMCHLRENARTLGESSSRRSNITSLLRTHTRGPTWFKFSACRVRRGL